MNDVAILKCSRFRFICIADQVNGFGVVGGNESPLDPSRESRSSTSTQAGGFDFSDDGLRVHGETFLEHFISTIIQICIDGLIPAFAVDIFKNEAVFVGVRLFTGKIFDVAHRVDAEGERLSVLVGVEKGLGFVRRDSFVKVVIDEADWGGAAGGETLGVFNGEVSTRRDGDGVFVAVFL